MDAELRSLQIDRAAKRPAGRPRWIVPVILLCLLLGAGSFVYARLSAVPEVETARVRAIHNPGGGATVLNATGYIVAAHKIELAAKVVGKVAWIGVDKGDHVRQGQELVRLEDDEYRAHLLEAEGQLNNLKAHLAELEHGSRPEEIAKAKADVAQARATEEDAHLTLVRTRALAADGVMARQALDDAQAKYDAAAANTASLEKAYELVRLGPRREEIDAMRAQVRQAQGSVDYAQTQLDNTIIRAPISGTILERNVEKGEFVTTGFVGDKGAKGYVVSLADLNDLQVELDISQNDFARLTPRQPAIVTTDAFPDRKYQGYIEEIAPEANRQKATVQVKVKIERPDDYLRPEMNASVAFLAGGKTISQAKPRIEIPAGAVHDGDVLVVVDGRVARRKAQALIGGEDVIVHPPADLKDGQKVHARQG
ncbi:MAG TPA: efflux RND transporter periplasmic adaptor subunit [Bryobacteraceae bacterium]|nr:efflux RND transporter periplasmic adaptor subunit [Bryobacteraceae bacterium]